MIDESNNRRLMIIFGVGHIPINNDQQQRSTMINNNDQQRF